MVSRSLRRPPEAHESISKTGMTLEQLVPEGQVTLYVKVLGRALAVLGVVRPPIVERRKVEVLAVDTDAVGSDQVADVVGQPGPAGRVGQVEQAREQVVRSAAPRRRRYAAWARTQSGWSTGQLGPREDPFRFEPKEQLGAVRSRTLAHRRQPVREAVGVGVPRPGYSPVALAFLVSARVPAGVDPPDVVVDSLGREPALVLQLVGLSGRREFDSLVSARRREQRRELASRPDEA